MLLAAAITEMEMRKVVIGLHPPRLGVPVSFYQRLARKRREPVQDITTTYLIEQVCLECVGKKTQIPSTCTHKFHLHF